MGESLRIPLGSWVESRGGLVQVGRGEGGEVILKTGSPSLLPRLHCESAYRKSLSLPGCVGLGEER